MNKSSKKLALHTKSYPIQKKDLNTTSTALMESVKKEDQVVVQPMIFSLCFSVVDLEEEEVVLVRVMM